MVRVSGAVIDLRTEYYGTTSGGGASCSDWWCNSILPRTPAYKWMLQEGYEFPFAVHTFRGTVDWTSRGSDFESERVKNADGTWNRTVGTDNYRYGVLFKIAPAAGTISKISMQVVVDNA